MSAAGPQNFQTRQLAFFYPQQDKQSNEELLVGLIWRFILYVIVFNHEKNQKRKEEVKNNSFGIQLMELN